MLWYLSTRNRLTDLSSKATSAAMGSGEPYNVPSAPVATPPPQTYYPPQAGYPVGSQPPAPGGYMPTPATQKALVGPQEWSTGLFDCFADWSTCCYGYWCLPCLYGETLEHFEGGGCCSPCCIYYLLMSCCCMSCFAGNSRKRIREKYSLPEEPCSDCCVHCWCTQCAVCQEAREIRLRVPK